MHTSSPLRRRLGYLLFAIGFLAGLWLLAGIAWANLEASLFGSGDVGENLTSLRCSLLVTPDEMARAQVTLENPLDRPIERFVRWRIAQKHVLLSDEYRDTVSLQPGDKQTIERDVSPSSGVYGGRFLMVSVYVGSTYPLPALEGSCGVWVISIPWLSGMQLLILGNLIALLGMGLGLLLVRRNPSGPEGISGGAVASLLLIYIIGMGATIAFRWWAIGGGAALLMVLLMVLWLLYRLDQWGRVKPPI
jgi:hypothetical protein